MSTPERKQSRQPVDLQTEYEDSPVNVDPTRPPRFSWRLATDARNSRQIAYRLVVGRDPDTLADGEGTVWDSDTVESGAATDVVYEGPDLAADETYYWSVKVRTERGKSEWADPARFGTALKPEDWHGEWISHQPGVGDTNGWRSQWRSSEEDCEEWIQIDLGESRDVSEITLHPSNPVTVVRTPDDTAVTLSWFGNPIDGFGFPVSYRVEVSDDSTFADGTVVAKVTLENENDEDVLEGMPEDGEAAVQTHGDIDASGRFVRVTATDLYEVEPADQIDSPLQSGERLTEATRRWRCFALAALTVRDGDEDRSAGADVTASSSIEAETWGRDHLVNGSTESRVASSSPQLRTEFHLDGAVASARIHTAALGYGEISINGDQIGDAKLDPAWTEYEKRVLYSSHDVTDVLSEGENALGVWLGQGWFAKQGAYWVADGSPRARVTLFVEFENGRTRTISSDGNWQATESPLLENDIYDGERYDARREQDGWTVAGFDDSTWDQAAIVDNPGGTLRPERIEPMGVVDTFDVNAVHDHPEGPILDFGQNLTGWLEIEIEDADEGDEIALRHAEALTEEGDLSTTDLRSADATDIYVARGDDRESYEPRFTYHGFRYAQVAGYPGDLDPDAVTAKVVSTAMDRRGEFRCSNEDLNQLQHNAVWGLRSNTHSIPEDCPQRDERFGWTGDAHISTRALLFNFDAIRFDEKWARDHDDVAADMGYVTDVIPNKASEDPADPTWSITRIMVPWYLYRHDGDGGILREQYEGMREYVDYWTGVAEDGIVPDEYGKYGDWLAFENTDGRRGLPHDLFNTAFVYQVAETFAKIADVLGNDTDAANYRERAEYIEDAFNDHFFDPEASEYGPGTQSSYSVPLFLGMVPKEHAEQVAANLAKKVRKEGGKLQTGFLGTRPLIHTLADHGYEELAYEVVSQPEQPGWVYMARNGATTMWERWDSDESVGSGMNSLNHSPFVHISEFFYEVLAGIRLGDEPITDHVTIAPAMVDDLEWVNAKVETRAGDLEVIWERNERGYDCWVTIPWNAAATIWLPDTADAAVTESDIPLAEGAPDGVLSVETDGDDLVLEVGSGEFEFAVE
ncbi:family 78 glycoside hydrolase catalytic domain [Halococcus sp. IIIV-5B]|uniref:family 78 glycoside hydrolase catalytic domain n=1 Tax=Halococcus sp. IIIV-5B TaxID=2321230 RepID=UPI0018F60161|nr:family 78 glycoside hydrolase catalytic domain [Halococcus sp. IIIV-5B]